MNIKIIDTPFRLTIHGFSAVAVNKDYADTAFRLMDSMWKTVKGNHLANKGLNVWVYEPGDRVFAGVELVTTPPQNIMLEEKNILLEKYAYCKHTGPYHLVKQTGQAMHEAIRTRGLMSGLPYIEMYGHWTNDETKLETELLVSLVAG